MPTTEVISMHIVLLCLSSPLLHPPESGPGRHFSWHRGTVFYEASRPPDAGDKPGRTTGAATCWHGTPEPRVPNAAWHQDTTGDGDCRIQEAAGRRGQVREAIGDRRKKHCFVIYTSILFICIEFNSSIVLLSTSTALLPVGYQQQRVKPRW